MKRLYSFCFLTFLIISSLTAEDSYGTLKAGGLLSVETSATGVATGERYRVIDDSVQREVTEAGVKTRSYVYTGMAPVSVTDDGQTLYISTDVRGSVRLLTDRYGMVTARAEYDAFGIPTTADAVRQCGLGYAGKPYDFTTQLYNYGFRDYSPATGRFTSVDPIRWGYNWYAYVNGDPVNCVDLFGLINLKAVQLSMQDSRWGKLALGGSTADDAYLVEQAGCYLTGYSSAAITLTGNTAYTPDYFNGQSTMFDTEQNFDSNKASEITGLINDYWTKATQGDLTAKLNELNQSETEYVVMAQIPYDEKGHLHWVEVYGGVGKDGYIGIVGTSVNDTASNSLRSKLPGTWKSTDGEEMIKASEIVQLRTFEKGYKEVTICGETYHY